MIKVKSLLIAALIIVFFVIFIGMVYGSPVDGNLYLDQSGQDLDLEQGTNMGWLLLRYFLSVLAIIALIIFGVRYIVEKFQPEATGSGNWVQVIDQVFIGSNKGLMLVDIEGKGYVLGISDHAINVLTTIEDVNRMDELRNLTIRPIDKKPLKFNPFKKITKPKEFSQSLDEYIERSQALKERGRDFNE